MDRIGPYVLEAPLGKGAFGVVYRGHHADRPQTPLAIKVVENRGNLDRLMLEPALLSKLDHPSIVHLEDYFLDGDRLVLALEFVEGDDLKTCLERGETFDQGQVRELLAQLAGALQHAHAQGVVHRDLKPSNVLVDRAGGRVRFVLTDFGIGRVAEGIQTEKHTGGTYLYMAPEQLRGRPGPQSDLWALGVVAYQLLTGRLPFDGHSVQELSDRILYATPPPPSKCTRRPVDGVLEGVVFHLLEKSLTERTASAADLLQELGVKGRSRTTVPLRAPRHRLAPSQEVRERRNRRLILVYRVLLGVLVLFYLARSGLYGGLLLLAGLTLFYLAQGRKRWGVAATAGSLLLSLGLMAIASYLFLFVPDQTLAYAWVWLTVWLSQATQQSMRSVPLLATLADWPPILVGYALALLNLLLPLLIAFCYAAVRTRERASALRRAALDSGADPEKYLEAMRAFLDYRFEDVAFHLKYAEALLARGRLDEVVVEARLLLRQDPYNFGGNLLLANAYFALGLYRRCVRVCDEYLEVAGYCFEFNELKQQCGRREGVTR